MKHHSCSPTTGRISSPMYQDVYYATQVFPNEIKEVARQIVAQINLLAQIRSTPPEAVGHRLGQPSRPKRKKSRKVTRRPQGAKSPVILTWVCVKCGWANDNNPGPCRKCGAL